MSNKLKIWLIFLLVNLFSLQSCATILYRDKIKQIAAERLTWRQNMLKMINVPLQDKFIYTDEHKTKYLETGQGEPVILLHGAAASAPTWFPVIEALAKNYRVIVPDVVGHGESDKPVSWYDRHYYASWLNTFTEKLGLEKVNLVGNSQGGSISAQFAIEYPEKVNKLILVDSGSMDEFNAPFGFTMSLFLWHAFHLVEASMSVGSYLTYNHHVDENVGKYSIAVLQTPGGTNAFLMGMGKAVQKIPDELLATIKAKTLLIWGREDQVFSVEQARHAKKIIPQSELKVISRAGHLPFFDRPAYFNRILLNFLKESD